MSRTLLRNGAVALFALCVAATAHADSVCDPANPNADPNCAEPGENGNGNGGNNGNGAQCDHVEYADTCGEAEACAYADTCESAATCDYADLCGEAETCVLADTCAEADHASTCDEATYAASCDEAAVADVALSVGECVSGVWAMDGAPSPDCGPLVYDGNVGIGTQPEVALDVAGPVALRGGAGGEGLRVTEEGQVTINALEPLPYAALHVGGYVVADAFIRTAGTRTLGIVAVASCSALNGGFFEAQPYGSVSFTEDLSCSFQLPDDTVLQSVQCAGGGAEVPFSVHQLGADRSVLATFSMTDDLANDPVLETPGVSPTSGGSYVIHFEGGASITELDGCVAEFLGAAW